MDIYILIYREEIDQYNEGGKSIIIRKVETCFFVYDLIFYTCNQIKFFYIEKSNNQIVLFEVIKYRKIR